MKKFVIDQELQTINYEVFQNIDEKIEEIVLPEGLKIIEDNTFFDNIYLKKNKSSIDY